jgi:hypothetical protein
LRIFTYSRGLEAYRLSAHRSPQNFVTVATIGIEIKNRIFHLVVWSRSSRIPSAVQRNARATFPRRRRSNVRQHRNVKHFGCSTNFSKRS